MNVNKYVVTLGIIQGLLYSHMAYATQYAYVACQNDHATSQINVINTASNTVINTISLPSAADAFDMVLTPNNQYLYVTAFSSGVVAALNLGSNVVTNISVGSGPVGLAATPDSKYVYVANEGSNSFSVINTATNANIVGSPFSLAGVLTNGANIAIAPNGVMAYITDQATNKVAPVTLASNTIGSTFTVGGFGGTGLEGIAITPDSGTAYVCNAHDSMVYPVTGLPSSPTVGAGITVGTNPWGIVINSRGTAAYVANRGSSNVSIINLSNNTVTTTVTVGSNPTYLAITPDDAYVYVANESSQTVSVINTATYAVTTISASISPLPMAVAITNQQGNLDTVFGNVGYSLTTMSSQDTPHAIAIQTGDKIVLAGSTKTTDATLLLAQYTSSGVLDTANFNSGGTTPGTQTLMVGTRTEGWGVAIQPSDNKIVVAGFAIQSQTNMFLARYNTNGSLDTAGFNNPNGYITQSIQNGATANAVGIQSTGKIIAAGSSVNSGAANFTLARFTSAGALDATFGTSGITTTQIGVIASIQALAIIPSSLTNPDYIIAVGNSDDQITIARYTASGILDNTFGSSGIFQPNVGSPAIAYDVALDTSGNIVIAGSANVSGINQSLLIRCTPGGALDTSFNTTGYVTTLIAYGSEFYSLALQGNNAIVASGYGVGALTNQTAVARYLTTGALDAAYGSSGITLTSIGSIAYVQDVQLQSSGTSIIAGSTDGTILLQRYVS